MRPSQARRLSVSMFDASQWEPRSFCYEVCMIKGRTKTPVRVGKCSTPTHDAGDLTSAAWGCWLVLVLVQGTENEYADMWPTGELLKLLLVHPTFIIGPYLWSRRLVDCAGISPAAAWQEQYQPSWQPWPQCNICKCPPTSLDNNQTIPPHVSAQCVTFT